MGVKAAKCPATSFIESLCLAWAHSFRDKTFSVAASRNPQEIPANSQFLIPASRGVEDEVYGEAAQFFLCVGEEMLIEGCEDLLRGSDEVLDLDGLHP